MTPTEAYRAALEAAAQVADEERFVEIAEAIRSLPIPDFPPDPRLSALAQTIRAEIEKAKRELVLSHHRGYGDIVAPPIRIAALEWVLSKMEEKP